jgi:hypothetical protein
MTVGYALAIKRLYGAGIVRVAAKHNLREIAAELGADGHIDAARIADNFTLRGPATADGVAQLAKSLMESAGVTKCRKTAVMALELLFTLPAAGAIDPRQYFEQATIWAEQHFGVPVLSCVVHLDEGAPHAHALLLPLVAGRMGGSDLHGGKAKLWAMQTDFHNRVGAHFGFARQAPTKRHSMAARAAGMAMLRDCFQTNTAMSDAAINVLLKPHAKDPEPLLVALGFVMPAPKAHAKGSFVAMMTAPCKPEPRNPIGKARSNPIGKAVLEAAPKSQPYTCVGIAFPTAPIPTVEHHVDTTGTPASNSATAQQASSSPAAPQSTTDQQRERSTTSIEQCSTDTGNPASPAPATRAMGNQTATLSHDATEPGKTGMALSTVCSTVEAIAVERSQQHAHQQVGQQSDHDAGLASAAPTKRPATKRQAKTVTAAPARPTSATPKRKRNAPKVASTTSTTSAPATAHHRAAGIEQSTASPAGQVATANTRKRTSKMAASTSPSPRTSAAGIAPAADPADTQLAKPALQQDQQNRAHAIEEQAAPAGRPQTGNAGIEVTVDTPATRTSTTGIVPANDTRAGQPAVSAAVHACQHLASNDDVTPRNAKASQAASVRRAKTSTATPASAPAAPRTGKWSSTASRPAATPLTPSISTRSTSSTAAPSTSTPKPKRTATLQQASGTPAPDTLPGKAAPVPATPTKRRTTSRQASDTPAYATVRQATSSKPALRKGQYDAGANQPDEIRTLGLAACISLSSASHSAEISAQCSWPKFSGQCSPEYSGQLQVDQQASQRAGEDNRHGMPAPMPASRINGSATARPAAQAGIAAHARHRSPTSTIEQVPPQGAASTVVQLRPLEGEQVQRHVDSYQRLRDDEHAVECWDSERGEFVTAQARPAKRASSRCRADEPYADDLPTVWLDARPAAIEAALDSIRAAHGQH